MFSIIDPISDPLQQYSFDNVHYYHAPNWSVKKGNWTWLIWDAGLRDFNTTEYVYNFDSGDEEEVTYTDSLLCIKGMIELNLSAYNNNIVWLKFFEVTPEFKHQGLSKIMIAEFIEFYESSVYKDKTLEISSFSEEGKLYLKNYLIEALDNSNIKYSFSCEQYPEYLS